MTRNTSFWAEDEPVFAELIAGPFGTPYVRERCQIEQVPLQYQAPDWAAPRRTPDPAAAIRAAWPATGDDVVEAVVEDTPPAGIPDLVVDATEVLAVTARADMTAALALQHHPTLLDMARVSDPDTTGVMPVIEMSGDDDL
jgi:hypothetical protein